ncbi:hypothetical protein [Caballeronia cordobensis]|uniref:hypothetical protein n=1 Tax=Caballeronia cordobensis TaxID=1353886 RepID=UPI00045EF8A1|nr:hypothetical protein BRPE67_CCDS07500 [Burkholderia sp. RPE67]
MSETQLQRAREKLREVLGQRSVILIFVGHDALSGPLGFLQEAIIDAPLAELLSHLSRPALGTREQPYDPRHFEWSYFVVVGTSDLATLGEFKQPTLELPSIAMEKYPGVLEEGGFRHRAEIYEAMKFLPEPATEAAICLCEQIRRIEQVTRDRGRDIPCSDFGAFIEIQGLYALAGRFFAVLSAPGWEITRALVLLTAFAIGGIKRATLLRCLMLWNAVLPDEILDLAPNTTAEWTLIFDDWLEAFAPLLRSGPDERWREIDPQQHPFEYPGTITFNLTSDTKEWWAESIDFLIMEVRAAIVAVVQREKPGLAEQIHRILAEEALRQHTMVLRHTAPGDRLTMRSHRRGLQALYHGLASLPSNFDRQSGDPEIWIDTNVNAVLPAQHVVRFRYLYCGLLPKLLVDSSTGKVGAAWGAERVKLEVSAFADDLLFKRCLAEPDRQAKQFGNCSVDVFERHYDNLAVAAVRAGSNGQWHEVRRRLDSFYGSRTNSGEDERTVALREKALLQMNLVEHGPENELTAASLAQLARRLELDVTGFDHQHWLGHTGFPSIDAVNKVVACHVERVRQLALQSSRSDAATLYFFSGMMRADLVESRISDVSPSAETLRHTLNQLLRGYAALTVAREVMWDGYGADNFPLPYLAAEGMRSLCRVALEIVRILQKREHRIHLNSNADVLILKEMTSAARNCLDEYTRVFYADTSERAQMLILESRFSRLAYRNEESWTATKNSGSVLVEPEAPKTADTINAMRFELAFSFVKEAELCLANDITSDAVRIRFLSERCSTLRHLSASLSRLERKQEVEGMNDLERAKALCQLALLDVRQLRNLIDRLKQTNSIWLTYGRKARWGNLVDYHEAKLEELKYQLSLERLNVLD